MVTLCEVQAATICFRCKATQEDFAVSCNNRPMPSSGEKKTILSSEIIPRRLAVREMEINKILIAIGRKRV